MSTTSFTRCICLWLLAINCVMCACPMVTRAMWGARPPRSTEDLALPAPYVVIHHTYIPAACNNSVECTAALKRMQDMHQISNGWNDIGYNFCVGGDGQVYEGRGWDKVGAHAPKYNFMSIGICFIGDYRTDLPPKVMLESVHALIGCGVERGSLTAEYQLVGHSQVRETECPGGALLDEIKSWPHWQPIRDIQPRASTTIAPILGVIDSSTASAPITGVLESSTSSAPITDVLEISISSAPITTVLDSSPSSAPITEVLTTANSETRPSQTIVDLPMTLSEVNSLTETTE